MNKNFKMLYFFILIFLLTGISCTDGCVVDEVIPSAVMERNVGVTFFVASNQLVSTRGEAMEIKSLRLLVFDEDHHFLYSRDAVLEGMEDDNVPASYHLPDGQKDDIKKMIPFQVKLLSSSKPIYIHFIANHNWEGYPQDYFLQGKDEGEILAALTTDHTEYWRRLKFDKLDAQTLKEKVVKLLRNTARLSISMDNNSSSQKFVLNGFKVYQKNSMGTVVPFRFIEQHMSYEFPENTPSFPTIPAGVSKENDKDFIAPNESVDLFERMEEVGNDHNFLFIILKGKYNGKDTYYKIDWVRPNEQGIFESFNIIRNHWYKLIVGDVSFNGYASEEEAINHIASNNVFGSFELADFGNVSDGKYRLNVNPIGNICVKPGDYHVAVSYTGKQQNVKIYSDWNDDDDYIGEPIFNDATGKIDFTIKKIPEDRVIIRSINVVAKTDLSVIYRKITLVIRSPFVFNAKVSDADHSTVILNIPVPNSIPITSYPFDIDIIAHDLTPDVERNKLLIRSSNGDYFYRYTVRDKPDGNNISLVFKRNNPDSRDAVKKITLSSKYFSTQELSFK